MFAFLFLAAGWLFCSADLWGARSMLFEIKPGETLSEVAEKLEDSDLIRSNIGFRVVAKFMNAETTVRTGRYPLSSGMLPWEILHIITDASQNEISVTIPEGFSVFDIDERLTALGLTQSGEFLAQARAQEGFLFPDTYFVSKTHFSVEGLIKKMRDNFDNKVRRGLEEFVDASERSLSEVIIMASILEKEVRTQNDYPVVAGILWKRLDNDWPLQVDATSLYGKSDATITQSNLEEDSPYNTRKHKSLPPTPIGNPGFTTIMAALQPEDSPYWFYLTDKNATVHYAVTNEEHNENREKYLE